MSWKPRPAGPLEQEIAALKTTIALLRTELNHKEDFVGRLQFVLRSRLTRIDEQANTIAVLRDQNKRLTDEADHLAELVKG
jgi:hypothetical protein